jgi:CYTH domain-containing protein
MSAVQLTTAEAEQAWFALGNRMRDLARVQSDLDLLQCLCTGSEDESVLVRTAKERGTLLADIDACRSARAKLEPIKGE